MTTYPKAEIEANTAALVEFLAAKYPDPSDRDKAVVMASLTHTAAMVAAQNAVEPGCDLNQHEKRFLWLAESYWRLWVLRVQLVFKQAELARKAQKH